MALLIRVQKLAPLFTHIWKKRAFYSIIQSVRWQSKINYPKPHRVFALYIHFSYYLCSSRVQSMCNGCEQNMSTGSEESFTFYILRLNFFQGLCSSKETLCIKFGLRRKAKKILQKKEIKKIFYILSNWILSIPSEYVRKLTYLLYVLEIFFNVAS